MDGVEIRAITEDELPRFVDAIADAFHDGDREEILASERVIAEPDRYFVAIDGDRFVATAGACTTTFMVPGGSVTAPGVTAVGVVSPYRRRGLNTRLMATLLDQAAERGEPLAYLWASESGIYRRFGYGMASLCAELAMPTEHSNFVPGTPIGGEVRLLPREEALPLMRRAYDAAAPQRPGMITVDDRWWRWLHLEQKQDDDEPRFFAVHVDDDGSPDGYVVYRVKHDWSYGTSQNELKVQNMICATPAAEASLWRYLLDVDLVATVKAWDRPSDDAVLRVVQEPRRLRFTVSDGIWVRLVDVVASLGARRYAVDGRLVIEVHDAFRPETSGRFELEVDGGMATCRRTDADADLSCDVTALGAAYLGGSSFGDLHRAGQVEERRSGAVERARTMFTWDPAPWFGFIF